VTLFDLDQNEATSPNRKEGVASACLFGIGVSIQKRTKYFAKVSGNSLIQSE